MPVLLLFVALPLIEIALFILIGSQLGVVTTLAIIILGALLGITILRGQKARAVAMMQGGMRVDAGTFLAQGAFRVVAGLLLILPGFLTDTIGLLLLIPPLQRALIRGISVRATVATGQVYQRDDIIEGEFEVREPRRDPADPDHRIDDSRGH
ncbi:FxsA family protein [Pararhodobacter sp.]|uniref:FxsA family protein n=1 Tax=Pararhodobacter sp. TaxID=2127056 RepID=UPI002AFFD96B|nr:FxsA family protein [Pararhodobacter sp.]